MRWIFLGTLLAVAAGVAWLLLDGGDRESVIVETSDRGTERVAPEGPARVEDPTVRVTEPSPEIPQPEDPEWITVPLPLPTGRGPLTGEELIAAVDAVGKVRFRGATPEDLAALRGAVFEHADREAEHPHAAMMGWLKEAGFEVEVRYPSLVVRRRASTDHDGR